ncbi:hypothetical protein SapgrDRAFT_0860 [Saprospira grandis DSM 2844]|uniref:Uncharacterized protein n=1 Tax=Saprospira grandis DSM 2844 TaxID=694433 RepID=J1I1N2_9BACT|nr:hypothetical protein [Saprospira grandis]EJF52595.1 hypothetical protein SapgrDRAFT_0860 [Saprospira grandis DSM 2844]
MKEIEFELNGAAYSLRLFRPEYTAALQQAADYPEVARGMSALEKGGLNHPI